MDIDSALLFWQNIALAISQEEDCLPDLLAGEHDRLIYRIRSTCPEGGWRAGESWFLAPCLCREEATALLAHLSGPDRHLGSLGRMPKNRLEILPTPLADVISDEACRKELADRLKSLTPYGDQALPAGGEWVWFIQGQEHWNLWLQEGQLHFPADWSAGDWEQVGPLKSYQGVFEITDGRGMAGMADPSGKLLLPCRYHWLSNVSFYHHPERRLEAQLPGAHAEESDLIDLAGNRINPPGIKVLAGTFAACGQAVVVREGEGEPGLKGLMDIDGCLLGELRWRWIDAMQHDRRAAVQDDPSGLWGYIDDTGAVVVPCRFHNAHPFNDGRAFVEMVQEDGMPGMGLIDADGQIVIEPCWKAITHLRHDYLVEDFACRHGVFDREGRPLLEPQMLIEDDPGEDDDDRERRIARTVQRALDEQPRHAEALNRIAADPQHRLAGLANLFGERTGQRDLIVAGLWGMRVEIVADGEWNGWDFKAGDQGHIFWQYPVSANLFNLAEEAPVMGLFGRDDQCLGVAWKLLRQVDTKAEND
ncbi:hypothetical protein MASR1M60_30320 [Rhodocyclaceae bacterium]